MQKNLASWTKSRNALTKYMNLNVVPAIKSRSEKGFVGAPGSQTVELEHKLVDLPTGNVDSCLYCPGNIAP